MELGLRRIAIVTAAWTLVVPSVFLAIVYFLATVHSVIGYFCIVYACCLLWIMPTIWTLICIAIIRIAKASAQHLEEVSNIQTVYTRLKYEKKEENLTKKRDLLMKGTHKHAED